MVGEDPLLYELVDVVELRDFNQNGRDCRSASGDEFDVSDGREEGRTPALSVLPTFSLLETKRRE